MAAGAEPTFDGLGLPSWLVKVADTLSITTPTPIQQEAIPAILSGGHVAGAAATGSGKTLAFAMPILKTLSEEVYGVFAVILTPSRELAYQINDQLLAFGSPIAVRTLLAIGGSPHNLQLAAFSKRPHIIIGTPGRLKFLFEEFEETKASMRNLRYVVLDEADRLCDDREPIGCDTCDVVNALPRNSKCQMLLFSATLCKATLQQFSAPLEAMDLNPEQLTFVGTAASGNTEVELYATAANLREYYLLHPKNFKLQYLVGVLNGLRDDGELKNAIIFANSCYRCELVRMTLQLLGFPVTSMNGLLTQKQRINSLATFKLGVASILVATDLAARGLDIPTVDHVIHYDLPKLSIAYIHRAGRTARAGRGGTSITLTTQDEEFLQHKIEKKIGKRLTKYEHRSVTDDAIVSVLDEVSQAKVEAKVKLDELHDKERLQERKDYGQERRSEMNKAIRDDAKNAKLSAAVRKRERGVDGSTQRRHDAGRGNAAQIVSSTPRAAKKDRLVSKGEVAQRASEKPKRKLKTSSGALEAGKEAKSSKARKSIKAVQGGSSSGSRARKVA